MIGLLKIATETYDNMLVLKTAIKSGNNDTALYHCEQMLKKQEKYIEFLKENS